MLAPDGNPYYVRADFYVTERQADSRCRRQAVSLVASGARSCAESGARGLKGIWQPDDIWEAIVEARTSRELPGSQAAAISARIVMLQSGIRASMGVRVTGPDLETLGAVCSRSRSSCARFRRSCFFRRRRQDHGKPYLEIEIDRAAIAQYAVDLQQVQDVIEIASAHADNDVGRGPRAVSIRVRYMRELRDSLESLENSGAVEGRQPDPAGTARKDQICARPMEIKSENTFLASYVLFDMKPGHGEVDVVEHAASYLRSRSIRAN